MDPGVLPWGHLLAARFPGMPADCWGAGSSQSTENQRAGCRGHKEAPEGAVRTRPSLLKRMSGPDTHPPPAVGCANGAFTASHYRISSCVMLPVRGTGILSRQKSAMAGGAFLSNLAWLLWGAVAVPYLLGFVKAMHPREEVCLHTNQCLCQRGAVVSPGGCSPLEVNTPQACPRALAPPRIWTLSSSPG